MRISITIDDGQNPVVASSPTETSSGGAPATATAPEPSTGGTTDIPRDLAARAAALGARSGGPAPTAPPSGGAPPLPSLRPGEPGTPTVGPTTAGGSPDLSGGAAPGAEGRTPQAMVSADIGSPHPSASTTGATDVDAGPAGTHTSTNDERDGD